MEGGELWMTGKKTEQEGKQARKKAWIYKHLFYLWNIYKVLELRFYLPNVTNFIAMQINDWSL